MNVISLGDETAAQLGVTPATHRKIIFFAASVMVGASVAVAGLIGFVGLVVPHVCRMIFGPDHRCRDRPSILQGDGDAFGVLDDMVVGDDVAVPADNPA